MLICLALVLICRGPGVIGAYQIRRTKGATREARAGRASHFFFGKIRIVLARRRLWSKHMMVDSQALFPRVISSTTASTHVDEPWLKMETAYLTGSPVAMASQHLRARWWWLRIRPPLHFAWDTGRHGCRVM